MQLQEVLCLSKLKLTRQPGLTTDSLLNLVGDIKNILRDCGYTIWGISQVTDCTCLVFAKQALIKKKKCPKD